MGSPPSPPYVRLVPLPPSVMRALAAGDARGASVRAGFDVGPYLATDACAWLWRLRLDQIGRDPGHAEWVARAAIADGGAVVGHAGFHGPPDAKGRVEIGYEVDPAVRGRGYAKAMIRALLAWAAGVPGVRIVRASIAPTNHASLGALRGFDFAHVGEQMDEVDGLEWIYERVIR